MKLLLCNEVIRELDFAEQCDFAAKIGYDGLELAPFTLSETPHQLSDKEINKVKQAAKDAGIEIVSLHWLLVTPEGLSITSKNDKTRKRTIEVMRGLIDLCAALGGKILVHGSPQQRKLENADSRQRGIDSFAAIADEAERAGVTYCLEPLSKEETDFINSTDEAVSIVKEIGSPVVKTMLDCRAAWLSETESVEALLKRWLPTGHIKHIHLNETNKLAPGQGEHSFSPILESLIKQDYRGAIGVEPFVYEPDGPSCAARAIGYLKGILETLEPKRGT